MQIKVTYTAEAFSDVSEIPQEHVAGYADDLKQHLTKMYPDAEIVIEQGERNDVLVVGEIDYLDVFEDIFNHWQPWIDKMVAQMETVGDGAACPECGQNRVDYLVWINDDYVTCTSCGCTYSL